MNIGTGLYVRYEVITFSDTIDESKFRLIFIRCCSLRNICNIIRSVALNNEEFVKYCFYFRHLSIYLLYIIILCICKCKL